jgi:hypothetical protein
MLFSLVNTLALISWIVLIAGIRRDLVYRGFWIVLVPVLGCIYGGLILSFFTISGGGYGTLNEVKMLLSNDAVLLSGWVHYLLFDFFVGMYIAKCCDEDRVPFLVQTILLVLTFMFGPLGLLLYVCMRGVEWVLARVLGMLDPLHAELAANDSVYRITRAVLVCTLAAIPMTFAAYMIDSRTVNDANVWAKPLKFMVSFGIHFFTVLAIMPLISKNARASWLYVWACIFAAWALILEVVYIFIQALRGRASHFNDLTQFEDVMYGLMGVGAVIGIFGSAVVGVYVLGYVRGGTPDGVRLGAGWGLVLGSALTFVVAGYLGSRESSIVAVNIVNNVSLPFLGWSMVYGDLRVPHFFATHTMQILSIVGVLATLYAARYARALVCMGGVACICLVLGTFMQALYNIPFITIY